MVVMVMMVVSVAIRHNPVSRIPDLTRCL